MPPVKIAPLRNQPVTAGRRQPVQSRDVLRGQLQAIVDLLQPVLIVATAAGLAIKQATSDGSEMNAASVLVLQLVETAAPSAVAQTLPFRLRHLSKRLAPPKRSFVHAGSDARWFRPLGPSRRAWLGGESVRPRRIPPARFATAMAMLYDPRLNS